MSQEHSTLQLRSLAQIEHILYKGLASLEGPPTPHSIMNCLKAKAGTVEGDVVLTRFGHVLNTMYFSQSLVHLIQWVAFHFSFPGSMFKEGEPATRNWISLEFDKQDLVNRIHEEKIKPSYNSIRNTYAPSVLSHAILDKNRAVHSYLRRPWLYWIDECPSSVADATHSKCARSINDSPGSSTLCFLPVENTVRLYACNEGLTIPPCDYVTLGALLDEDEGVSYSKYMAFCNLVRDRRANEFPDSVDKTVRLTCNYYARIPTFFHGSPEYMTESFVAFYQKDGDVFEVARALSAITPFLRIVVSLVNSHIAYTLGDLSRKNEALERERMIRDILMRVVSHGFGNWTQSILQSAGKTRQIIRGASPDIEEALRQLERCMQDCGIGVLTTTGLKRYYGLNEAGVTVSEVITILRKASLLDTVRVSINTDLYSRCLPGRIILVLSELIANAVRVQRNDEVHPVRVNMKVFLDKGQIILELENLAKHAPDWLADGAVARQNKFPKERGLSYCASMLEDVSGYLSLRRTGQSVIARVQIPEEWKHAETR